MARSKEAAPSPKNSSSLNVSLSALPISECVVIRAHKAEQ